MLRETVEIVKLMWSEPDATTRAATSRSTGAQCDPKPLQQPHPPIWIGGGGEQLTLRVVARHATHSNFGGKPDEWAHKRDVLRGHCAAVGRDPDEITMTWSPEVFIRETEAEIGDAGRAASGASRSSRGGPATWSARPSRSCEQLAAYRGLGCGGSGAVGVRLPRGPRRCALLAEQVMPEFQRDAIRRHS